MDTFTLSNLLERREAGRPTNSERVAVAFEGRSMTFEELDCRSGQLAAGLLDAGFRKGERACILSLNRLEWIEIIFALAKIGGVYVPVNHYLKAPEVAHILRDSGATWAFVEAGLHDLAEEAAKELDAPVRVIAIGETAPAATAYEDLVDAGSSLEIGRVDVRTDDLLLLQYTSGTTGYPKAAMHTHATILWNALHQVADFGISHRDALYYPNSLCWAGGFHSGQLATLWAGGKLVLHPSTGFHAEDYLATIERERITIAGAVPSVLRRLLGLPTFEGFDLSSARMIVSGGEPVPVSMLEELNRRLPSCDLVQVYGWSEFPSIMLLLDPSHAVSKMGSAGRACLAADVRVVDDQGNEVEPGTIGEIICRSPATMVGYFNKPEETARTIVDGWVRTGDLAVVDDDYFVTIVGRSKEMFISGGLNVYPAEVERVLGEHDAVHEVAVVGVPDDTWGQVGKAVVVTRTGSAVTEAELETHARAALATYKVPRVWELRTEPLPRTTSGKVQKYLLAEEMTQASPGQR